MKSSKRIQIVIEVEIDDSLNTYERAMEKKIKEIETTIVNLRQSIIRANSLEKKYSRKIDHNRSEVARWHRRAELAVFAKNDYLAREALLRKRYFRRNAAELKTQMVLDQNTAIISNLQQKLNALEMKVVDLKVLEPNCFNKVQVLSPKSTSDIFTSSAITTFERLDEKIKQLEAESEIAAKLGSINIEQEFAALDALSNTDDDLAAIKEQLIKGSLESTEYASDDVINAELNEINSLK